MLDDPEQLASWLRMRRRQNKLQLDIMALMFDLEGAVEAGQVGLAWSSQETLLMFGLTLNALERGLAVPESSSLVADACAALEALAGVDPAVADRAWQLWLRPLPHPTRLSAGLADTLHFLTHELGMPSMASRGQATKAWADGVDILRRVASVIGLAQSDEWYLPREADDGGKDSWYEDVLAQLPRVQDA
jgi:hypothetical protein